jgi:hypothetical protein
MGRASVLAALLVVAGLLLGPRPSRVEKPELDSLPQHSQPSSAQKL